MTSGSFANFRKAEHCDGFLEEVEQFNITCLDSGEEIDCFLLRTF